MSYEQELETKIFRLLAKDITADLISNGIPSFLAGSVVKFYDPAGEDYLLRVDAWQKLLCGYAVSRDFAELFPQAFVDAGVINVRKNTIVLTADAFTVKQLHQVIRMMYKYHGNPRKDTDWEAVKARFRRPGHITLDNTTLEAMRAALDVLQPPTWYNVIGRFGPGVSADGADQFTRWSWKVAFPATVPPVVYDLALSDTMFGRDWSSGPEWYRYGITKVAEVPKSIKTNRFVSSEPAVSMFNELAIGDALVRELHKRFPDHVSLTDQEHHNRLLTKRCKLHLDLEPIQKGKFRGCKRSHRIIFDSFATIDLSDASDHISRTLVWRLMPKWREFLFSVRSTFARFPDGEIVPLRTFAPMGSGVCFPVLTAVCLAACYVAASEYEADHPGVRLQWSVYGDDQIVPICIASRVMEIEEACGLVVNRDKSCSTGCYRESCGKEFFTHPSSLERIIRGVSTTFDDVDITPIMIREHPAKVASSVLEFWLKGLSQLSWTKTTEKLYDLAEKARPTALRWNQDLQRLEVRVSALTPKTLLGKDLPGRCGLVRWYCIHSQQEWYKPHNIYIPSRNFRYKTRYESAEDFPHLTSAFVKRARQDEKQEA